MIPRPRLVAPPAPMPEPPPPAFDADIVVYRLEEAGMTLLALPNTGHTTALRQSRMEIVRTALDTCGWSAERARPSTPDARHIDRMDEALGWITLIPRERYVLRRIVGARALVSPLTERHLFSWRRLGGVLGADHKAVKRWHTEAIGLIVAALNRRDAIAGGSDQGRGDSGKTLASGKPGRHFQVCPKPTERR